MIERERLEAFVAKASKAVAERDGELRAAGQSARRTGLPVSTNPHAVGSYYWSRWIEGWAGELMPTRTFNDGRFNMSPLDEVTGKIEFLKRHGVAADEIDMSLAEYLAGYTDAAVGLGNA